jgi:hypothetical protein
MRQIGGEGGGWRGVRGRLQPWSIIEGVGRVKINSFDLERLLYENDAL